MDQFSPLALQQANTYSGALKDRLVELLRSSPMAKVAQASPVMGAGQPAMGGMVGQAQQTLQNLPYQRYVQEMQAQGQQPLGIQQFMQQQGQ